MAKKRGAPQPPVVTEQAPEQNPIEPVIDPVQENEPQPPVVTEQAPLAHAVSGVETAETKPLVIATGSVSLSSSSIEPPPSSNVVHVTIRYPKNYAGERRFKDGDVREVSPETAAILKAKGIIE